MEPHSCTLSCTQIIICSSHDNYETKISLISTTNLHCNIIRINNRILKMKNSTDKSSKSNKFRVTKVQRRTNAQIGRDKGKNRRMLESMRGSMASFVTRTANVAVAAATNI